MPYSTYSELKTFILDQLETGDTDDNCADWIGLAEARLNRELGAVETDASLTGTTGSRRVDVSSLSMVQPIALFIAQADEDEQEVLLRADGTFPYLNSSGTPGYAAFDGTYIDFDRPLDQDYPLRLRYRQRFALSDASPTNWLLTYHPDVYIAATMVWGFARHESFNNAAAYKATLEEQIPEIRNSIAQKKRGVLTVDRAISSAVTRTTYNELIING